MRINKTILFFLITHSNLFGQPAHQPLKITRLTGDFYIYTTYNTYKGNLIPANGMYVVTQKGVLLFDTPWDTTQFQPLIDSIQIRHHQKIVLCMATHSHEDRTGGLAFYRQAGVQTFTTQQTDEISRLHGRKRAQYLINKDTTFAFGEYSFQTYYGGPGHTADNIVIWFEKQRILYGGCLIKSVEASDLGNLTEANVPEWDTTLQHIRRKCKSPKYIIPGHGDWTSLQSLNHTLELIEDYKRKNGRKKY